MKDTEVQYVKQILSHPRNRMRRTIRNTPAKILVDRQVLEVIPYFNANIKVNENEKKNRRKEAIFDKIIKQLSPNNDQYYIGGKKKKKN